MIRKFEPQIAFSYIIKETQFEIQIYESFMNYIYESFMNYIIVNGSSLC